MKNRKHVFCLTFAILLQGCGLSKPAAKDIEPYLMNELNQCPLWTITNVRKVDGVPGDNSYRVDFSAKLALKATPTQTLHVYEQHGVDPAYMTCHSFISALVTRRGPALILSSAYDVTGAGDLVKSEKGWQLQGELHDYSFTPISGSTEGTLTKVGTSGASSIPEGVQSTTPSALMAPESAPLPATISSCVEAKMAAWQKQRDRDTDSAAAAAQAKGEEIQSSAGQDALVEQEAMAAATAACQNLQ